MKLKSIKYEDLSYKYESKKLKNIKHEEINYKYETIRL